MNKGERDKDLGDSRRVDRWTDNLSTKNFAEVRRGPSDNHRWNDPEKLRASR